MNIGNNESLTHRIFFWLCLLCGLRGGDIYQIRRKDLESRQDGGFELVLHKEKNNQGSAFYRNIHGKTGSWHIPIPPDQPNNQYTPVKDILLFLSKLPESTLVQDPLFYETSKSKKDLDNGRKITNHSCRHTVIQLLRNNGVSELELQSFSGHHSRESLADYSQTSEYQRNMNTAMLIPYSPQDLDDDYISECITEDESDIVDIESIQSTLTQSQILIIASSNVKIQETKKTSNTKTQETQEDISNQVQDFSD
ncbi:3631_t:CDS:2 [Funneliformis mosseae]|uniref:3631_t:CDS:1 n=1 Tax=Funneliformis mosseae TaxID=27381 RepID=A0A9N8VK16_FUNMO|nr:3631_t:CDS:2 [Funneliformis mosseae]